MSANVQRPRLLTERQQGLAYLAFFATAVLLVLGAVWDFGASNGRYQPWFVAGLVAVIGGIVILLLATWRTRDEERYPAATLLASVVQATVIPAGMAGPVSQAARVEALSKTHAEVTGQPRTTAPPEPAPRHDDRPERIPRPTPSGKPSRFGQIELIAFETGDPHFRAPEAVRTSGGPARYEKHSTARVLCGACNTYFQVYVEVKRPLNIACTECATRLGLRGETRSEAHLWQRCRQCGESVAVPRLQEVSAYQCATCGQRNELRAPSTKGVGPGATHQR